MNILLATGLPVISIILLSLAGCGTKEPLRAASNTLAPVAEHHTIYINRFGDLTSNLSKNKNEECSDIKDEQPQRECEKKYNDNIFENFKALNDTRVKSGVPPFELTIFVHGGLNTFFSATTRSGKFSADMLRDGQYPVFFGWDSGGPTNYLDHLSRIRKGENRIVGGILSSPFILLEDVARSITRFPTATYKSFADPLTVSTNIYHYSERDYDYRKRRLEKRFSLHSTPPYNGVGKSYATIMNPAKLLSAPFVDGLGTGAWGSMLRRADLVLSRPSAFEGKIPMVDRDHGDTAVTSFIKKWINQEDVKDIKVNLIGHSMGAIVANNIVARHPNLNLKNVVYMAGAARIKDVESVIVPWMRHTHEKRFDFYNLSLDPYREIGENAFFDFTPRGSLLDWIDNIFGEVNSFKDRTVGSWWNIVRSAEDIFPESKNIHLTRFPIGGDEMGPQQHGEFDEYCFWRHEFWVAKTPMKRHPECTTPGVADTSER